ncbi:MAG: hypothetical protein QOD72_3978 [Acidimicrobiaceae bacterium]|jgi:hypothetical protein|nr:hypothetical protein [Acidimicrobiaceae bacterium]
MRNRVLPIAVAVAVVSGCSSSGGQTVTSFAAATCPVVMGWADDSTTAVNEFEEQSPALADAGARRALYEATFARLDAAAAALADRAASLPYPNKNGSEIRQRLDTMVTRVRSEYADDLKQAQGLADDSYVNISVNNGLLFTGNEKAKAIVFETVGKLWEDFKIVDENCGRHPPVTVDLKPG